MQDNKVEGVVDGAIPGGSPLFASEGTPEETRFVSLTEDQLLQYINSVIQHGGRGDSLNIAEFAHRVGITPQYLGRFLAGKVGPGRKLLKYLGVRTEITTLYIAPVEVPDGQ